MDKIKKLAKKSGLGEVDVTRILAEDHLYKNHYPKKQLKNIEIDLDLKTAKMLDKITKALKVERGAVVSVAAQNYLRDAK